MFDIISSPTRTASTQNAFASLIVAQSTQSTKLSHLQNYSATKTLFHKNTLLQNYSFHEPIASTKLFFCETILPQNSLSAKIILYGNIKATCFLAKIQVPGFFKIRSKIFGKSGDDSLDNKIKSGTRRDVKIYGPWGVPHGSICALSLHQRKLAGFGSRKGKIACDRKNGLALSTRQDQTLPLFFFKLQ